MKKLITIFTISTLALLFSIAPVLAVDDQVPDGNTCDDGCSDTIYNRNSAVVNNMIMTRANTGLNMADGSYAGDGGSGGAIVNSSGDVEQSGTGAGWTGGNAGVGGTIATGNATATSDVTNLVNSNLTDINRCGCSATSTDCDCSNDRIRNQNRAFVGNGVLTDASSGINNAVGSYAGDGGAGGAIVNNGDEVDSSTTGPGANGGTSAAGGYIQTGDANSLTTVINVVNRNLTRILR